MELKFICITPEGEGFSLESPLEFRMIKSYSSPCTSVRLVALCENEPREAREFHVMDENGYIFNGYADKQSFEKSERGNIVTIEARGAGMLLVDNEAVPGAYYNATMDRVMKKYVKNFRHFRNFLSTKETAYEVIISKGMSRWEAICHFAKIILGEKPYLRGDRDIVSGIFKKDYLIENPIEYKRIYNQSKIISAVVLRDENGLYRKIFFSPFKKSKKLLRSRYYIEPREWQNQKSLSATDVFRSSLEDCQLIELLLDGIRLWEIGDTVIFEGKRYVIKGIEISYFKSKMTTRLSLVTENEFLGRWE